MLKTLQIILFVCLLPYQLRGASQFIATVDNDIPFEPYVEIITSTKPLNLHSELATGSLDVRFLPFKPVKNPKYLLARFEINNPHPNPTAVVFLTYARLDQIKVYKQTEEGFKSYEKVEITDKHGPVIKLQLQPGSNKIYLEGVGFLRKIRYFGDPELAHEYMETHLLILGILWGAIVIMAVSNLGIFFLSGHPLYLPYLFYLAFVALHYSILLGVLDILLGWKIVSTQFTMIFIVPFHTLGIFWFSTKFLEFKTKLPKLYRAIFLAGILIFISRPIGLWDMFWGVDIFYMLLALLGTLACSVGAVILCWRGSKPAYFYLLGFGMMMITQWLGVYVISSTYTSLIGIIFEISVFSLGIGYKIKSAQEVSETEIINLNVELLKSAKLKDEFLANTSHELRTPLNGILGFTGLIKKGFYNDDFAKISSQVVKIENLALNLKTQVNTILDLSKSKTLGLDLKNSRISLNEFCDDLRLLPEGLVVGRSGRKFQFAKSWQHEEEPHFIGDHEKLMTVVSNFWAMLLSLQIPKEIMK